MSHAVHVYMKKEWNYYDENLGKALESVEKGNLYEASVSFQRIAWALRSLDKYHPPNRIPEEFHEIATFKKG